jgi:A/G-specific adenine glycosylase
MNKDDFRELIWQQGRELYRDMPWRVNTSPYYVLVSELMLQQTQVDRVIPKFKAFIERFPDVAMLAAASLSEVLTVWSGLGYNRRAKYLHEAAKIIMTDFDGVVPSILSELTSLTGVGPSTAAAVLVYGFNQPVAFIETNIRTVYFYHFFSDRETVGDKELLELVRLTVDAEHPRQWYWALMDYGSFLKRSGVGNNNISSHYAKQSPLTGSIREVRGQIIQVLTRGEMDESELRIEVNADGRFEDALKGLIQDGLVEKNNDQLHLTK